MNAVWEAREFARQVGAMEGVKGIFSMPPNYFKPDTPEHLVDTMALIAAGAPHLPFWYYHFPAMTNVPINMYEFVKSADASGKIPNLMGVKFTFEKVHNLASIGNMKNGKYNTLMGRDEMLTSALCTGAIDSGVSSTIQFMTFNLPIQDLYESYEKENIDKANQL